NAISAVLPAKARRPSARRRDLDGSVHQAHAASLREPGKAVHGFIARHGFAPMGSKKAGAGVQTGGPRRMEKGVAEAGADGGQRWVMAGAVGTIGIPEQRLPPSIGGGGNLQHAVVGDLLVVGNLQGRCTAAFIAG